MLKMLVGVTAAVALSAGVSAYVVSRAGPSTAELDRDIEALDISIAAASADAAQYTGGLLLVQTNLRLAVLQNTREMLDQKRKSFVRGILLSYQDATPRVCAPADDSSDAEELARARDEERAAHQEAAMYAGGLIQAMALVREATAKATAAAIEQRVAFAKLGIPVPRQSGGSTELPERPGTAASDRDALK